jgi:hypothetical protein
MKKPNKTVFTAICDGVDNLVKVSVKHKETTRFIAFMGDTYKEDVNGWEVLPDNKTDIIDPRRRSRWYKFNSHLLFKEDSLWLDGRAEIPDNLEEVFGKLDNYDIVETEHPKRDCLYDEADEIIKHNYARKEDVLKQVNKYKEEGFPEHFGLNQNGAILRKNTPAVKVWNELVFEEYINGCRRDQVCSQYVTWKTKTEIGRMPSKWFKFSKHKMDNRTKEIR